MRPAMPLERSRRCEKTASERDRGDTVHSRSATRRFCVEVPRGVVGKVKCPAPSLRVWYNPRRTVPRRSGQHLFSYCKPGFALAGIPAALLSKAVRHSLLAKLTIPITTVRSAHTAMIVWVSIASPIRSKPPRRRSTINYCTASEALRGVGRASMRAPKRCLGSRPDRRKRPRCALRPRTQSGHNAHETT